MTKDEVELFQKTPVIRDGAAAQRTDWFGLPLRVDGDFGPKTRWAYAISLLDPRRQAIIYRATSKVGVTESSGPNRSPTIDEWNARCGVALGSPYCASFASWCLSVEGMPVLKIASAQQLGKSLPGAALIAPGDLMWFPTGPDTGHCGIIIGSGIGDGGYGELAVVEGNQDNAVRVVRRRMADPVRVARTVSMPETPGIPPGLALVPAVHGGTR